MSNRRHQAENDRVPDGAALADRRPKHKHTVNESAHSHGLPHGTVGGSQGNANGLNQDGFTSATNTATTGLTVGPQTAGTPTDTPSFVVVTFIIKT